MTVDPTATAMLASAVLALTIVPPLLDRCARPTRTVRPDADQHDARAHGPAGAGAAGWHGRATSGRRLARRRPIPPEVVARWLDDVSRATRIGTSLTDALGARAADAHLDGEPYDRPRTQLDARLQPLRRRLHRGDALATALAGWRDALDPADEAVATAATVLIAADQVGGSPAAPLERAAALLRSRAAEADERAAWSAQARLSARVLAFMPVAVLVVLVLADGDIVHVLSSPIGMVLVGLGLALDLVGFLWMRRVVRRAAR